MKPFFSFLAFFCFNLNVFCQLAVDWQKSFGGSSYEQATNVIQSKDSSYIILGYTLSNDGDISYQHGGMDYWLIKLSPNGEKSWEKTYGGSANDFPTSMIQTTEGDFVLAGYSLSNNGDISYNHGDKDVWIVKINPNGNIIWQKSFGGSKEDVAYSICETSNGYTFIAETSSSDGDVFSNHGVSDFWVVNLDKEGILLWQKTFGGSKSEKPASILQTTDSGYIIAGETKSNDGDVSGNNGNLDYWVIKISSQGGLEWQKCFGGLGLDSPFSISESDGYLITGYSGSGNTGNIMGHHGITDQWVIKINYTGELQWQNALGGSDRDYGYDGIITNNHSYVTIGTTYSVDGNVSSNHGESDFWLTELDSSGNLITEKTYGGSNADVGFTLCQTFDNSFLIAGSSTSFDGDISEPNQGETDVWIVKLSPTNTPTQTPKPTQLTLYPNPTTQQLTLQTPDNEPITNIQITDLSGKTLKTQPVPENNSLQVATLAKGMYLLKAHSASGKVFCGKFIKE